MISTDKYIAEQSLVKRAASRHIPNPCDICKVPVWWDDSFWYRAWRFSGGELICEECAYHCEAGGVWCPAEDGYLYPPDKTSGDGKKWCCGRGECDDD